MNFSLRGISQGILLAIGITVISTSCTPRKKLLYLQESKGVLLDTISLPKDTFTYRLEAKDIIYISIKGLDDASSDPISNDPNDRAVYSGELGLYLNSYTVDDSGYVTLPFIGDIKVLGLTIGEARSIVQKQVSQYLINPWVNIKLSYFQFSILGEVKAPGVYRIYENNVNVLEALAYSGDLNEYGNRQEIMIIREEADGQKIVYLDISDLMVINSDYFNLMPNDIIYVKPYRAKNYGIPGNTFMSTFSSLTGALTSLISIYLLADVLKGN